MVAIDQIGWGSYAGFEGPYWAGRGTPFKIPSNPSDNDKILAVITASEGGSYSAINMYDRMILTVGVIQWGEAGQYSVSDMLGCVAKKSPTLMAPMREAFELSKTIFMPNKKGNYRFFFEDRQEVDTIEEQQRLFLGSSNGLKGTWDDESKVYAKTWAACVASVFEHPDAQEAQIDFTAPKLRSFAFGSSRSVLFGEDLPNKGWVGALRAMYLSFAANLPAVAMKQLDLALEGNTYDKWSPEWCLSIVKQLTFGPKISIYPGRYNAFRPVVERLFEVDLPDFAKELEAWRDDFHIVNVEGIPNFTRTTEIQEHLITLGYDLGSSGADGVMGPKTADAVRAFQVSKGITATGLMDPLTKKAFEVSWASNG
jgi:hypothetical protein